MTPPNALQNALTSIIDGAALSCQTLPNTPIKLWLIEPAFNSRTLSGDVISRIWQQVPYWIFCWASGLALAQRILANPDLVRGKTVLDFGAGSGVVAIAAKLAGARQVIVCDIDALSLSACQENAALNGVELAYLSDIFTYKIYFTERCDVLLAADVLYDKQNAHFLDVFLEVADSVLVADSRVKDFSHARYLKTGEASATTWPDMDESAEFNCVSFYRSF